MTEVNNITKEKTDSILIAHNSGNEYTNLRSDQVPKSGLVKKQVQYDKYIETEKNKTVKGEKSSLRTHIESEKLTRKQSRHEEALWKYRMLVY